MGLWQAVKSIWRICVDIEGVFDRIEQKLERIKMTAETAQQILTALDTATTEMAARFQLLLDTVGPNPDAADLAILKAGIEAEIVRLNGMGRDGQIQNP